MSKRGETKPWKVTYRWDNGISGVDPYSSYDVAEIKADEIRRAGDRHPDLNVSVTITYKPTGSKAVL